MNNEKLYKKLFSVISYVTKKEVHPQNSVTFFKEIDCSIIENIRLQYSMRNKKKLSYTAFIIKAISEAVKEHPFVNARVFPGFPYSKIIKFPDIHTAVACEKDMPGAEYMALLGVIKHTNEKKIDEIYRELNILASAKIENNPQIKSFMQIIKFCPLFLALRLCTLPAMIPSLWMKYRGSSISISSPSKYGVDAVAGTWLHPIGISFGLVQKKAIVKNNKVEVALCFTLTMCWDRRVMAGAPAARFFNSIASNLVNHDFLASQLEENISKSDKPREKIIAMI